MEDTFDYEKNDDYQVLFKISPPARLGDSWFVAKLNSKYNRTPHPKVDLENKIDEMWIDKQKKLGKALWNATKFRLHSYGVEKGVWFINLGLTDYKTFQGTNRYCADPLTVFGNISHISMNLGCACYVITKDNMIPLLVRSNKVGEGAGMMCLPGGHGEPSRIGLDAITDLDDKQVDQGLLMRELFESILLEAIEELHVDQCLFDKPNMTMVGLVERIHDHRPQLVLQVSCSLTAPEIEATWKKNSPLEQNCEAEDLLFLPVEKLRETVHSGLVNGKRLMPEHRAALSLFL